MFYKYKKKCIFYINCGADNNKYVVINTYKKS